MQFLIWRMAEQQVAAGARYSKREQARAIGVTLETIPEMAKTTSDLDTTGGILESCPRDSNQNFKAKFKIKNLNMVKIHRL